MDTDRFGLDQMADRLVRPIDPLAFVAESTLGRLAKWLRLAGFDTRYDPLPPEWRRLRGYAITENRIVLTRTLRVAKRLVAGQGLLIRFDAPIAQVRQVVKYFNIGRRDLKPQSRCSRCNRWLQLPDQAYLQAGVPDFIRQRHERFLACNQCGRIYWAGSHSARMEGLFDRWFSSDTEIEVGV
jgi:uncharacterized protein